MKLRPEEITAVLKNQIENYEAEVEVEEVGRVLEVGDGIARVHGLESDLASLGRDGRDDDHRQRLVLHECVQEREAVHARHLDVERDDVRLELDDHVASDIGIPRGAGHVDTRVTR